MEQETASFKRGLCKILDKIEKYENANTQSREPVISFSQIPSFKRGGHLAFPELSSACLSVLSVRINFPKLCKSCLKDKYLPLPLMRTCCTTETLFFLEQPKQGKSDE